MRARHRARQIFAWFDDCQVICDSNVCQVKEPVVYICRLEDNSARLPTKVVPSCDTTWGRRMDALDPKITEWDFLGIMPIPFEWSSSDGLD